MIVLFKDKLIECSSIIALELKISEYSSKKEWILNIQFSGMGGNQFSFDNETDAVEFRKLIIEAMDVKDTKGKTYLDGFKDGTEYAIKLFKETK